MLFTLAMFSSLIFQLSFAEPIFDANGTAGLQCLDSQRRPMGYNNPTVIQWKKSTPNQFKERAYVQGVVTNVYPRQTNSKGFTHSHFAINIDQIPGGDLEIIFNDEFGPIPSVQVGMPVVACGDYITANQGSSLPSPMGAILHWIHYNPGQRDGGAHLHGYVVVNNVPYGFTAPPGEPTYQQVIRQ